MSLGNGVALRAIRLPKSTAFQFQDKVSKANITIAPAVGELTDELRDVIADSEVVLFDGTFWKNDELQSIRPAARSALGRTTDAGTPDDGVVRAGAR